MFLLHLYVLDNSLWDRSRKEGCDTKTGPNNSFLAVVLAIHTLSTTILYASVFKILIKLVTHKLEMAELEVNSKIYFSEKHAKQVKKVPKKY